MRKAKVIVLIITMTMILFSLTSTAFAGMFDDKYEVSRAGEYLGSTCKVDSSNTVVLSSQIQAIYDANKNGTESVTISTGNGASITLMITPEGKAQLEKLAKDIYDKESIKNTVKNMGENFDVRADTDGAGTMLSGIQPLVSVIVGVIAYIVVLGMSLFTAFDIVYITMPVFRNKVEEMKQTGNAMVTTHDRKTGEAKLRWVTDEAQHAVMICTVETGRNPLGVYFKKRIWAYVLVAIVIYILLTGNITLIVNIAINFISGVLDALADLGR